MLNEITNRRSLVLKNSVYRFIVYWERISASPPNQVIKSPSLIELKYHSCLYLVNLILLSLPRT